MAHSIFDHIEESYRLFDELCEEQERFPTLELTDNWLEVRQSIRLAKVGFDETHANFVKPLPLFKYLKEINE